MLRGKAKCKTARIICCQQCIKGRDKYISYLTSLYPHPRTMNGDTPPSTTATWLFHSIIPWREIQSWHASRASDYVGYSLKPKSTLFKIGDSNITKQSNQGTILQKVSCYFVERQQPTEQQKGWEPRLSNDRHFQLSEYQFPEMQGRNKYYLFY